MTAATSEVPAGIGHWGGGGAATDREDGYVLALTAAALIPLVAIAALAVDFAVWQSRGAELQRAADAAALAAVPALPSLHQASDRARAVAAANGVVHGVDGREVGVEVIGRSQARVTVADPAAPRVFSLPFLAGLEMRRSAVAEWVEPVSLGSPRNFLGTGNLAGLSDTHRGLPGVPASAAEGYWLGVNGPCASRETGDWLTGVSEANVTSDNPPAGGWWRGCTSAADPAIVMVRPDGPDQHLVALRVPSGYPGGAVTVQVFDAAYCGSSPLDLGTSYEPFTSEFTLFDGDRLGPQNPSRILTRKRFGTGEACGADPIAARGYECAGGSWSQRWCNLDTISDPVPGAVYLLSIAASPVTPTARHGANAFAVRAMAGQRAATGLFTPCSTDPHDLLVPYRPDTCVAVEGRDWLSVTTTGAGRAASFNLAEVGAEYAGAVMEVSLFDIGEGSQSLQLLDPSGSAVGFRWSVDMAPGDVPPSGGVSGLVPAGGSLDVGGSGSGACREDLPQRGRGRISGWKYNDRMLRLEVSLPDDPLRSWGERSWWRVRYVACGDRVSADRTTWAVRIGGQPVRLVG